MACFLVPAAEAIVVTAAYIAAKKSEQKIHQSRRFRLRSLQMAISLLPKM